MKSFITVAAAAHSLVGLAAAQISQETSSDCPQQGGVHIIAARASLEPPGYGSIGAIKDSVLAQIPGSNAEYVQYPATLDQYIASETEGVGAARALITAYLDNCPGQPLVVMGYSQGAQVSADALVGQYVRNFPVNASIQEPLPESSLSRVASLLLLGDPSFVTNETFHVGNATRNSLFPRINVDNFSSGNLGSRTQSYCNDGDPYCAAGNNLIVHVTYVRNYGVDAATAIVNNVKAWFAANGSGSSSSATVRPRPSASSRAPSGTASRSALSASATPSSSPTTSTSASSPTASTPASTGAASSLHIAASFGAAAAGLLAFML